MLLKAGPLIIIFWNVRRFNTLCNFNIPAFLQYTIGFKKRAIHKRFC